MSIEKFKGSLISKGGLKSAIERLKEQKKVMDETSRLLFLLDVSGSMNEKMEDGRTCFSHLLEAIEPYKNTAKIFSFSTECWEGIPNRTYTSTFLGEAFQYVQSRNVIRPNTVFILVSDGLPNGIVNPIIAAKELKIPINIIFIGNDLAGKEFMEFLARETGGTYFNVQKNSAVSVANQLAEKIKEIKLLTAGAGNI
jgi:Mg-chelatase subunit ChlD